MYSFSCLVDFALDVSESVSLLLSRADSRVHVFVILVCKVCLSRVHMCWCMCVTVSLVHYQVLSSL